MSAPPIALLNACLVDPERETETRVSSALAMFLNRSGTGRGQGG